MCFAYPTPEFPTPSFEYHAAFNGVAFGIVSTSPFLLFFCCHMKDDRKVAYEALLLLVFLWELE